MAKIKNNPLLKGLSGMLGDVVVYRESRGKMIMSNRPKKPATPTEHQLTVKSRFLEAVQYAKAQMLDPIARAEYEAGMTDKLNSGYAVAVTDYLRGPEILQVNNMGYLGVVGNPIIVRAIDNFRVTAVNIEIRSAADVLIEQGVAIQDIVNALNWSYATTQANPVLAGTRIIISVSDRPGNVTTQEVVLP